MEMSFSQIRRGVDEDPPAVEDKVEKVTAETTPDEGDVVGGLFLVGCGKISYHKKKHMMIESTVDRKSVV